MDGDWALGKRWSQNRSVNFVVVFYRSQMEINIFSLHFVDADDDNTALGVAEKLAHASESV